MTAAYGGGSSFCRRLFAFQGVAGWRNEEGLERPEGRLVALHIPAFLVMVAAACGQRGLVKPPGAR